MVSLDPDVAAYLAGRNENWVPMHVAGVSAARTALAGLPRRPGPRMHRVEDRVIAGPHGPLRLRIYWPTGADVLPAVAYFHGGGMVIGSIDDFDILARFLAEASGAVVVSVDYRLAPEHPYPVATEEAYAAVQWIGDTAAELGVDPTRVAVAGDSAGATLAAGVALQTRDEGGVPLVFQLHLYAGIDRDDTRPSVLEHADGPIITAGDFAWTKNLYLGDDPSRDHPYGVPSLAADLSGLPDAIVVTASHDPSRDGAEEYGLRLRDAGVQVALLRYPSVAHGFLMHADHHARARLALAEIGGLMRAKLRR
ncbi:alpha/beta hydrolase [Saccharopolyspora shandongensis]|uniref:alpha/beta hydrolase n=1 Tax=Saccharopolyspora shandongensis TaxID=418495 RepID=UPI00343010F6